MKSSSIPGPRKGNPWMRTVVAVLLTIAAGFVLAQAPGTGGVAIPHVTLNIGG